MIVPRWKCVPIVPGPFTHRMFENSVAAHVEREVLDRRGRAERHPRAVGVGSARRCSGRRACICATRSL